MGDLEIQGLDLVVQVEHKAITEPVWVVVLVVTATLGQQAVGQVGHLVAIYLVLVAIRAMWAE